MFTQNNPDQFEPGRPKGHKNLSPCRSSGCMTDILGIFVLLLLILAAILLG